MALDSVFKSDGRCGQEKPLTVGLMSARRGRDVSLTHCAGSSSTMTNQTIETNDDESFDIERQEHLDHGDGVPVCIRALLDLSLKTMWSLTQSSRFLHSQCSERHLLSASARAYHHTIKSDAR